MPCGKGYKFVTVSELIAMEVPPQLVKRIFRGPGAGFTLGSRIAGGFAGHRLASRLPFPLEAACVSRFSTLEGGTALHR